MDFNSILNYAIPILIVVFFVGLFYMKLKVPTDLFLHWIGDGIRNLFMKGKEATESVIVEDVINYT